MIKLLRAWNIFSFAIFKLHKFSHASRKLFGQKCAMFHRFAVLWLHCDFLIIRTHKQDKNRSAPLHNEWAAIKVF